MFEMNSKWISILLFIFLIFLSIVFTHIFEPTRAIDLWNPLGTTSTRRPGLVNNYFFIFFIYEKILGSKKRRNIS